MTKHDPSYDTRLAEVKRLISQARQDQIQRLLQDILQSGETDRTKGAA